MNLGIDALRDPTKIFDLWKSLSARTFGKQLFSRAMGMMAPYTGTVSPLVTQLEPGHAKVQIRDRWGVRNHLKSVHAVALMNLGEAATGLAVMSGLPTGARGIVRELAMEYIKKARGTITAESRVELPTTPGTHDFDAHGELRNSVGEVVARVRACWRIELPGAASASASDTGASPAGSSASDTGASSTSSSSDAGATSDAESAPAAGEA